MPHVHALLGICETAVCGMPECGRALRRFDQRVVRSIVVKSLSALICTHGAGIAGAEVDDDHVVPGLLQRESGMTSIVGDCMSSIRCLDNKLRASVLVTEDATRDPGCQGWEGKEQQKGTGHGRPGKQARSI